MASVNLYTKFDWTDDAGNLYSDGSTSTAKTITVAGGEIFDRTYKIAAVNTLTEILSCGANPETGDNLGDFDFLWIESDKDGEIQLVCNEGGVIGGSDLEIGMVLGLTAGVPFVLAGDASRNAGDMAATVNASNYAAEIDTWETNWTVDVIDRIEFYNNSADTRIRVVAIT
jgi:hypothetical protein